MLNRYEFEQSWLVINQFVQNEQTTNAIVDILAGPERDEEAFNHLHLNRLFKRRFGLVVSNVFVSLCLMDSENFKLLINRFKTWLPSLDYYSGDSRNGEQDIPAGILHGMFEYIGKMGDQVNSYSQDYVPSCIEGEVKKLPKFFHSLSSDFNQPFKDTTTFGTPPYVNWKLPDQFQENLNQTVYYCYDRHYVTDELIDEITKSLVHGEESNQIISALEKSFVFARQEKIRLIKFYSGA